MNAHQKKKFMCCGFGVRLSWGTVPFEQAIKISELVEVDDSAVNSGYKQGVSDGH